MTRLQLSPDLSLPPEAVTETFGILAVRGAGKSNTAAVMAEEMFAARLPFVVVDPVSSWYGLRSSRDGKGPGLAIPIFGGKHGDVPLERTGGQLVADLIVDQRLSCVLDIGTFDSEAARKAFLLDFARRLYQRNEHPLHLFLEEADDYIPQRPMRDEALLLRAWENIVRRGRSRGLGMTLITQRSAAINKSVLTQIGTLIALRTTGPQDRAAIEEWLKYNAQGREILASLPGLADGEAWVWSPRFLGTTVRVRIRPRATYDSGATPKASATPRAPATLADVDLGDITKKMAATIEKAKAEDPKALRARIAELERELRQKGTHKIGGSAPKPVEVVKPATVKALERAVDRLDAAIARNHGLVVNLRGHVEVAQARGGELATLHVELRQMLQALRVGRPGQTPAQAPPRPASAPPARRRPSSGAATRTRSGPGDAAVVGTGGLRRMLVALAQNPDGLADRRLALLAGIAKRGGTFRTYVSRIVTSGWGERLGDQTTLTEAGYAALGEYQPLPTGPELLEHWRRELGDSGARTIFDVCTAAYPGALSLDEVAERAGIARAGGTFRTYISRLRTLELITTERGQVRAAEELFG